MKFLKWLAIIVAALAALLVVGGLLLSSRFTVMRSIAIDAPPDKVYALVADPKAWNRWAIWNRRDPAMQIVYSGPPTGVGAKWAWQSKSQGAGEMTLTAAEPPRHVGFDLYFPDFGTTSRGDLRFEPQGAGTQVTWTMNGDMGANPLYHWMALMADTLIGKDFQAGLVGLKEVAEKQP
jgi:uncharacterized protein YndB with AHSA1/START domain